MLTLRRVEKYCTRLDIVVWPSFPAPLSFQVGCSAFRFWGKSGLQIYLRAAQSTGVDCKPHGAYRYRLPGGSLELGQSAAL